MSNLECDFVKMYKLDLPKSKHSYLASFATGSIFKQQVCRLHTMKKNLVSNTYYCNSERAHTDSIENDFI